MIFQRKALEKYKKEANAQIKELAVRAKRLHSLNEYQDYAVQYQLVREKLVNEMLNCDEQEPIKYAFQMNSYVERIKALGILISEVKEYKEKQFDEKPEEKE